MRGLPKLCCLFPSNRQAFVYRRRYFDQFGLHALEAIEAYVNEINPGRIVNGEHRYIVNRMGDDEDAALNALLRF